MWNNSGNGEWVAHVCHNIRRYPAPDDMEYISRLWDEWVGWQGQRASKKLMRLLMAKLQTKLHFNSEIIGEIFEIPLKERTEGRERCTVVFLSATSSSYDECALCENNRTVCRCNAYQISRSISIIISIMLEQIPNTNWTHHTPEKHFHRK